jgi:hypothetical protein
MNRRERLWRIEGLPAVRVRAAERTIGGPSLWVMLHVSTSEFRTAIQPDVLEDFGAVPEMQRQQRLSILGTERLARPWRTPGLVFGDVVIPHVTVWVHPLEGLPEGIGGVLGLDVLGRIGAIINLREGWLTVHEEEPTPA